LVFPRFFFDQPKGHDGQKTSFLILLPILLGLYGMVSKEELEQI
jgi:hypothetical protein